MIHLKISSMARKSFSSIFSITSESQSSLKVNKDLKCFCESIDEKKIFQEADEEFEETENEEMKKSLWESILEESDEKADLYVQWLNEKRCEIETKNLDSPADYLSQKLFPILLSGMEEMLHQARKLNVLSVQKCRFNGLDYLAEYLWNKNPKRPGRKNWLEVCDIPQFKLSMRLYPRPIFPKSWLWSSDEAASHIQRYVRGWLVRKCEEVQELRQFWKAIRADKESMKPSDVDPGSRTLDICERYKLLAKKRERPF